LFLLTPEAKSDLKTQIRQLPPLNEQRRPFLIPFREERAQNNANQPGQAFFPVQLLRSGSKPKREPVDVLQ
jgi:hypothetical protein